LISPPSQLYPRDFSKSRRRIDDITNKLKHIGSRKASSGEFLRSTKDPAAGLHLSAPCLVGVHHWRCCSALSSGAPPGPPPASAHSSRDDRMVQRDEAKYELWCGARSLESDEATLFCRCRWLGEGLHTIGMIHRIPEPGMDGGCLVTAHLRRRCLRSS
jgi:hypothetical protein